jgi:hypothetical protein
MRHLFSKLLQPKFSILICAILIALPSAVAYASSANYFGPAAMVYGDQGNSFWSQGSVPHAWNKVYRPYNGCNPGSKFGLFYSTSSQVYNWCSNPFLDPRASNGAESAFCHDWNDLYGSNPTTCVTTKP